MSIQKRLERLEFDDKSRTGAPDADKYFAATLKGALLTALCDYPDEYERVFALLCADRLAEARGILKGITTDEKDGHNGHILTPRAVGGVIHLLLRGVLDKHAERHGNIADRMHEPLLEYCGDNRVLRETIVMLLYDLTGDYMVLRDHSAAFFCVCLNGGHAFRIE